LNFSVVATGGNSPLPVMPGAPMEPEADGRKASRSHPVGVIPKVRCEKVVIASHEFARVSEVPGAHEVGMRMNGPLLACPLKVSAIFVIWIGMPFESRGWSAKVDSSP
jgi:hypothetical protein